GAYTPGYIAPDGNGSDRVKLSNLLSGAEHCIAAKAATDSVRRWKQYRLVSFGTCRRRMREPQEAKNRSVYAGGPTGDRLCHDRSRGDRMGVENTELSAAVLQPRRVNAAGMLARALLPRGRLFRKYVLIFVGLVGVALLVNSSFDFWFNYQEN